VSEICDSGETIFRGPKNLEVLLETNLPMANRIIDGMVESIID
jgi:hypothetical protein